MSPKRDVAARRQLFELDNRGEPSSQHSDSEGSVEAATLSTFRSSLSKRLRTQLQQKSMLALSLQSASQPASEAVDAVAKQTSPKPGTGPAAGVAAALCQAVGRATEEELPQAQATRKRSARKRAAPTVSDADPSLTSPNRRVAARPTSAESRSDASHLSEFATRLKQHKNKIEASQSGDHSLAQAGDAADEQPSTSSTTPLENAQRSSKAEQAESQPEREQPESTQPVFEQLDSEQPEFDEPESDAEEALNPLDTLAEAVASQPVAFRNYKGQSRQMITMTFLEEGGLFDMPIQNASAQLGLGVTTLKRVCRENGIKRWPYRKRNSLGRLIDRTKQVLDDGTGQNNLHRLAALQVLEQQRQSMRCNQSSDMDDNTKLYRQAIFKLDHVQRKDSAQSS